MSDLSEIDTIFFEKISKELNPARWDEVILRTPHGNYTKRDLFNYYSHPNIRESILSQIKGKPSIIHQHFSPLEPVLKRWEKGQPINISKDSGEVDDPTDYNYWIERRAVEFHPALGPTTKHVFVDIDPKEKVDFKKTKEMTGKVSHLLYQHPDIHDVHLRFSGGKGFYVVGELDKEMDTDEARALVQSLIKPLTGTGEATLGFAKPHQIRLDTTTLKNTGSLRGLYSLNKETGLVSVPVEEEHLMSFNPEVSATMHAVVGGRMRNFSPLRK